ncbi:hypothetical protein HI914_06876 [Erysiphe necator]|nr:hypothetical protein HI914_06876 [Erysiphe necator]
MAIQLCFALRTSPKVKKVSLLGSWDNYSSQLPLSQKRKSSSRITSWQGTFRFQGTSLRPGNRYWYYYITDGHNVSYDPQQNSVREPITGRVLNFLDIPADSSFQNSVSKMSPLKNTTSFSGVNSLKPKSLLDKNLLSQSRRGNSRENLSLKVDIPKGRPLSISKIKSPKPITPHAAKFILETDYGSSSIQQMTSLFNASTLDTCHSSHSKSPSSVSSSSGSSFSDRFDSDSPCSISSISSFSDYSSSSPISLWRSGSFGVARGEESINMDVCTSHYSHKNDFNSRLSFKDDINHREIRK